MSEGYGYIEGNDRWVEWKVVRVKVGGVSVKSMGRMSMGREECRR